MTVERAWRTWPPCVALSLAGALSLLTGGCAPSAVSLEDKVKDEPGVIKVEVTGNYGDDDLPFAKVPYDVTILMDADASAAQIMAVFDAYESNIDDGDVEGIDVVLDGSKHATLAAGTGVHATMAMVQDLVMVQHDANIIDYRREAYPVLPSVQLTLASGDFDDVVAVADRYRNVEEIDYVGVSSGDFALVLDEVNEDPEFTAARATFVREVAMRFRLRGALVAGRGPLRLAVAPSDQVALRRFVERSPDMHRLGRVVVSTNAQAPS